MLTPVLRREVYFLGILYFLGQVRATTLDASIHYLIFSAAAALQTKVLLVNLQH